ncbi:sulfotransferase [Stappia sp. F7233]|uniref:Sulfotransferase n=1 Tax=Stappia albiluteola TaxID=2758565 RepID=A0A839AAK6_9HYPH|nr:sulfotransferase [Stappia albiluteola]MBA5775779.1 sulfotransferase [Stappia albiluteola]
MNTAVAFDRALTLIENRKFKEAEPILLDLHHRAPQDARINFSLGLIYSEYDDLGLALDYLEKSASIATKKSIVFEELGRVLNRAMDYEAALEAARKAVKFDPQNAAARIVLGDAYAKLQRPVLAKQAYEAALKIKPGHVGALIAYSTLEKSLGNTERSNELLAQAREEAADVDLPSLLCEAANGQKHKERPDVLDKIEKLLEENPDLKRNQLANLHYAAAKVYDDLGEMKDAFRHFEKGKEFLYSPYSGKLRRWQIDSFKTYFSKSFFEERKDLGFESAKPVFVFGMPRSGTTLTEQIIGRHSQTVGAGELSYFSLEQKKLYNGRHIKPEIFFNISKMDEKDFRRIGRGYLSMIDAIGGKARRVVDKMPHNFENLWLMALLFPNATFIHLNRNPIDNCISIYTTPLRDGHNYASTQKNLGEYYCMYRELMDHWVDVLPVNIRQQSYEALVANQEEESRGLIAHAGLEWEDACLEFYKGDRQVTTFSISQVRKPMYKSSVDRWRRYDGVVDELIEALGPYGPKR